MSLAEIIERDFQAMVPENFKSSVLQRDGGFLLSNFLNEKVADADVITKTDNTTQHIWELIGLKLQLENRGYESLEIFFTLYKKMTRWQMTNSQWTHKGMPLVWMADNFRIIGFNSMAKRFAMLTLVEDSIRDLANGGELNIQEGGVYFRLRYTYGMSHPEIIKYSKKYFETYSRDNPYTYFPEYILLESDRNWITEYPNYAEFSYYLVNPEYLRFLQSKTGDGTGKAQEHICEYVMTSMTGCRSERRVFQYHNTTDYDVVCSIDGPISDFRSELGRYIICESKDWKDPVDFTTVAKFSRILISTKTQFGVLFTKKGISGQGTDKYAARERKKVFQDSNIIIAVIDESDVDEIINGRSLIEILRNNYEEIRLDK